MKVRASYLSEPLQVVKDYGHAILASANLGTIVKIHKDNAKPYPARNLELYNSLPLSIKLKLGAKFNENELHKYINEATNYTEPQDEIIDDINKPKNPTVDLGSNPTAIAENEIDSDSDSDSDDSDLETEQIQTGLKLGPNVFSNKPFNPRKPNQPLHMK